MKKISFILTFTSCLLFSNLFAQTRTDNKHQLTIGPEMEFLVGPYQELFKSGTGATLSYQYLIAKNSKLIASIGYNYFPSKRDYTFIDQPILQAIPLTAGIKHFFVKNIYGSGELGVVRYKNDGVDTDATAFIYAPGLGIELPISSKLALDFGVRYEHWSTRFLSTKLFKAKAAIAYRW
jgi:hypothetical protein